MFQTISHKRQLEIIEPIADEWERVGAEWLSNLRSRKTQETYRAAWRHFLAWFGAHPKTATRQDVINYRDAMKGQVSASTTALRLGALASFYAFAKTEGLVERNPVDGVERPTVEAYAGARWLTNTETQALLRSLNRDTLEGKRDYAMLLVMLTMGLRRAEVTAMRVGDVVERGDGTAELRYLPKGGDPKTRPIPNIALRAVREYLHVRGSLSVEMPVFVAHDRALAHRGKAKALSGEAIRDLVGRYTERALGRRINPHGLRHTCAGETWELTHDMREVQHQLGHASVTTTEKYLHRRNDNRGALGDALAIRFGAD